MANTIITIEIAGAIKTALASVLPSGTTVYATGIQDTVNASEDKVKYPCAAITVGECHPNQYRSVLRSYPVRIEVATWYPEDKDQVDLYTMAHAANQWLAEPTLSLSLAHWDALTIDAPPEMPAIVDRTQMIAWNVTVLTRKAT